MGIKVQRPRCFFDIGISNVLGKEKLALNKNIHDLAVYCFIKLKYKIKAHTRNIHFKH